VLLVFPILVLCGDENGGSAVGIDAAAEDEIMAVAPNPAHAEWHICAATTELTVSKRRRARVVVFHEPPVMRVCGGRQVELATVFESETEGDGEFDCAPQRRSVRIPANPQAGRGPT
jgi:hypothetical protein